MKIDEGRPYHSNVFHELVSNGGPKLDGETERETKRNILPDEMVDQTNPSEHSFLKAEHQNGNKSGQIRIEDVSYDKDVVEIKLPDTIGSSDYSLHFVKDVCIDDGVLTDQKALAEKEVDENLSTNIDSSMGDTNGIPMKELTADSVKSARDLKPQIVVLPAACSKDGSTDDFNNLNGASPNQLESQDGAKYCQKMYTDISASCKNHETHLDAEAIDQVSSNNSDEIGASVVASETINLRDLPAESIADGFSTAISEEDVGAALDKRGLNHYNPFITYGSLDDTWEPKYSLPTIVYDDSIVPICPVEKTDSFSDLVNGSLGRFNRFDTIESIIEDTMLDSVEESPSRLDVQASGESNGQRDNPVEKTDSFTDAVDGMLGGLDSIETDEAIIEDSRLDSTEASSSRLHEKSDEGVNEIRTDASHVADSVTLLLTSNTEPSDVKVENHPKCEIDSVQDENDFNPRDMEGIKRSEDSKDSNSSTLVQTESAVQQNGSDSAKLMARTGIRNPFESSFSGPSITSGPLTPSGHIPYAGNISLRSDSSTTSTRSFAFPVLQTEWNSSPVKMAKADRERLRRRGWSYRILCCKF